MSFYACDEKGKTVHASNAERGKTYFGKCCGCAVHKVQRSDKAFFARNPLKPHKDGCPKLNQKTIKDIAATSPDELFDRWLKPRRQTAAQKKSSTQLSAAAAYGRIQRVSSQKNFYDLGLYERACSYDRIGEFTIGDYILTYDRIPTVMNTNKSIGMLSIPVRKDGYNDELLTLQFILLDRGPINRSKVFVMIFPESQRERYYAYRNLLYFSNKSGQISSVYVTSDWVEADFLYCDLICWKKCKNDVEASVILKNHGEIPWRCTGMQTGLFVNDVQIFIPGIPNPPRKKKLTNEASQVTP